MTLHCSQGPLKVQSPLPHWLINSFTFQSCLLPLGGAGRDPEKGCLHLIWKEKSIFSGIDLNTTHQCSWVINHLLPGHGDQGVAIVGTGIPHEGRVELGTACSSLWVHSTGRLGTNPAPVWDILQGRDWEAGVNPLLDGQACEEVPH